MSQGKKIFTEEHKAFMREMYPGRTHRELTALFNEHFETSLLDSQIHEALKYYRIRRGTGRFTEEQLAFIQENLPGRSYVEMAEMLNARFETRIRAQQILSFTKRYGWSNGRTSGFQPRHAGDEWTHGKYVTVKTDSGKWRYKHAIIWESVHGPIPPGHMIVFGDGNRRNFDPNNLVPIDKRAIAIMTQRGLIGGSAELTRTGKTVAELILAIGDRKKETKTKGGCK